MGKDHYEAVPTAEEDHRRQPQDHEEAEEDLALSDANQATAAHFILEQRALMLSQWQDESYRRDFIATSKQAVLSIVGLISFLAVLYWYNAGY